MFWPLVTVPDENHSVHVSNKDLDCPQQLSYIFLRDKRVQNSYV